MVCTNAYNRATGFYIVSPITSNIVNLIYILNEDLENKGQTAVAQIYTMGYSKVADRNIQYIEEIEVEDFFMVQ